jgi:hypothetical protein
MLIVPVPVLSSFLVPLDFISVSRFKYCSINSCIFSV